MEQGVALPEKDKSETKRVVLKYLATIYNPQQIASSVTLSEKVMFKEACDLKASWHNTLQPDLPRRQKNWIKNLLAIQQVPRGIPQYWVPFDYGNLHVLGDASGREVSAALYGVTNQTSGVSQRLLILKSRLVEKNTTISYLELNTCYVLKILVMLSNGEETLKQVNVGDICYKAYRDSDLDLEKKMDLDH